MALKYKNCQALVKIIARLAGHFLLHDVAFDQLFLLVDVRDGKLDVVVGLLLLQAELHQLLVVEHGVALQVPHEDHPVLGEPRPDAPVDEPGHCHLQSIK